MLAGLLLAAGPVAAQAAAAKGWREVYRARAHYGSYLMSVTAVSKRDAWAVGQTWGPGGKVIMRWDGVRWRKVTVSIPGAADFEPWSVAAAGPDDVWVFGLKSGTAVGEALVWNGAWRLVPLPEVMYYATVLPDGQVWGGNGSSCGPNGAGCTTTMWNWNGQGWASYTLNTYIQGLAGAGGSVWVLGLADIRHLDGPWMTGRPSIYQWSGSQWASSPAPAGRVGPFPSIAASPAGHLWFIGAGVTRRKPSHLDVWNGRAWTSHRIPAHADGYVVTYSSDMFTYDGHNGVWIGGLLHWTGRTFVNTYRPAYFRRRNFEEVAPIPGTRSVWGVGFVSGTRPKKQQSLIAVYGRLP